MEIQGVNLFGDFDISHYYSERILHLMNFVLTYANSIWSCDFFNTENDLFFWLLLLKVIERLLNEFSNLHSEFIKPLPDFICLDDHNLIGFIASLGDTWDLVEWNWMPEKNIGELRASLETLYDYIQNIKVILDFKCNDRPGVPIHLEIFDDISFFISSLEVVSKKLVETKMRCTQNQAELDDLKSKVVDLIDYFSNSDICNDL